MKLLDLCKTTEFLRDEMFGGKAASFRLSLDSQAATIPVPAS